MVLARRPGLEGQAPNFSPSICELPRRHCNEVNGTSISACPDSILPDHHFAKGGAGTCSLSISGVADRTAYRLPSDLRRSGACANREQRMWLSKGVFDDYSVRSCGP